MTMPVIFNKVLRLVLSQMQQTFINPHRNKKKEILSQMRHKSLDVTENEHFNGSSKMQKERKTVGSLGCLSFVYAAPINWKTTIRLDSF